MSVNITLEMEFFLQAALTGIFLSMLYDVIRIFRRVFPHGTVGVAIEDGIYWIFNALYITYILMKRNDGVIRWFFIFGVVMGMLFYQILFGRYLVKGISYVLLKFVKKPIANLWKKVKKILKKIRKSIRMNFDKK